MIRPRVRTLLAVVACLSAGTPFRADANVDFVRDIQPILAQSCNGCHGPEKQKSSLRLDSREFTLKGGEYGPVVIPGKSAQSLLCQVVTGTHDEISAMPKGKNRLTTQQIDLLRRWIDEGAKWPSAASAGRRQASSLASSPTGSLAMGHWAFKAPTRPELPAVISCPRRATPQ